MDLTEAIAALRHLNQTVPRPRPLPSVGDVSAAEVRLGVTFHPDYRRYLLEASDVVVGTLEPSQITSPEAHDSLFDVAQQAWGGDEISRDELPICYDNGDYYLLGLNGVVSFWSHNGLTDESWPDLATWIMEVWIGENAT